MTNIATCFNNLKTKVADLDSGKLKTAPVDLKKLSHVIDSEVLKNAKFNTPKTKVSTLEKKPWCNCFNSHKSIQHR